MKILIRYTCLVLLFAVSITAKAQTAGKPTLFSRFSEKIDCAVTELNKVFTATANQAISLSFSDNFLCNATVVSSEVKYSNLTTVVMRLPEFDNAVFVLSKISGMSDVSYAGRIINEKSSDGYELKKDSYNNYQLIKIETDKVLQVCSGK